MTINTYSFCSVHFRQYIGWSAMEKMSQQRHPNKEQKGFLFRWIKTWMVYLPKKSLSMDALLMKFYARCSLLTQLATGNEQQRFCLYVWYFICCDYTPVRLFRLEGASTCVYLLANQLRYVILYFCCYTFLCHR